MSTKSIAAALAASIRFGDTSSASIERDTSSAITTVARSRGTSTTAFGWAKATFRAPRDRMAPATAMCRFQACCRGSTFANPEIV